MGRCSGSTHLRGDDTTQSNHFSASVAMLQRVLTRWCRCQVEAECRLHIENSSKRCKKLARFVADFPIYSFAPNMQIASGMDGSMATTTSTLAYDAPRAPTVWGRPLRTRTDIQQPLLCVPACPATCPGPRVSIILHSRTMYTYSTISRSPGIARCDSLASASIHHAISARSDDSVSEEFAVGSAHQVSLGWPPDVEVDRRGEMVRAEVAWRGVG